MAIKSCNTSDTILARLDERIKALKEARDEDQVKLGVEFLRAERVADDKVSIASTELTRRLENLNHENERVKAIAVSCVPSGEYRADQKALLDRMDSLEKSDNIRRGKELITALVLPALISSVVGSLVAWIITVSRVVSK